jgi:hypothetical protein
MSPESAAWSDDSEFAEWSGENSELVGWNGAKGRVMIVWRKRNGIGVGGPRG